MKKLTILPQYTPEELLLFVSASQSFIDTSKNIYLNYILKPSDSVMKSEELLNFLEENNVDIVRAGKGFYSFADASQFVDLKGIVVKSDMIKPVQTASYIDDKLLYLPDALDGLLLFSNSRILKKLNLTVPKNWDELLNVLRIIKKKTKKIPLALHNLEDFKGWWAFYLFQFFLAQTDIDYKNLDFTTILKTPQAKEVFQLLNTLISEGLLSTLNEKQYQSRGIIAFAKDAAVFCIEGPWALSTIRTYNESLLENIEFSVLNKNKQRTIIGGQFFAVPSSSNNQDVARDLLSSLREEEGYYAKLSEDHKISGIKSNSKGNKLTNEIQLLFSKYGEIENKRDSSNELEDKLGNEVGKNLLSML